MTALVGVAVGIASCGSAPSRPDGADDATASTRASDANAGSLKSDAPNSQGGAGGAGAGGTPGAGGTGDTAKGVAPSAAGSATSGTTIPSAPVEIPKRALSDFERAVGLMRQGNATEAELEFKQLTAGYPQLTGAHINLALLQRKANRLEEAEGTLKSAAERNPSSAKVWNELGVTQRMRGEFTAAAASYEKAIAADANYAPAHRNYAVLLDLYLGDPEHALTELERYKELTGEDKPVTGWIAELRQRTGKPAAPRPAAAPTQQSPPADGAPAQPAEGAPAPAEPASSDAPAPTAPAKPAESPQPRAGATIAHAVFSLPGKGA